MSTVATSDLCQAAQRISEAWRLPATLQRLVRLLSASLLATPALLFLVYLMCRRSKQSRALFRKIFASCVQCGCDNPTCLTTLLHDATRNLAAMQRLEAGFEVLKFSRLVFPPLRREIAEWEELIEDCEVSADTELRDLVQQLAQAL
ncbi:MAG: hypothetical protein KQJ78_08330 [Deltaproteobacteria bacterium]|nr:hypothetical protein [Deltaproteobacteria bacterium]